MHSFALRKQALLGAAATRAGGQRPGQAGSRAPLAALVDMRAQPGSAGPVRPTA